MTDPITRQQQENAAIDTGHIATFMTSVANFFTTRLGQVRPTLAKLIADVQGLSSLVVGAYRYSVQAYINSGDYAGAEAAFLACNDAAAAAGLVAYLDADVTLTANQNLTARGDGSAKWVGTGGVITVGAYTIKGSFSAPSNVQMFFVSGGTVIINKSPIRSGGWFGPGDIDATETNSSFEHVVQGRGFFQREGASYTEYLRTTQFGGKHARCAVGMIGDPEANLSFNMDYAVSGLHRFYDPSVNGMWLALGPSTCALQFAAANASETDVWVADGGRYIFVVNQYGQMVLNSNIDEWTGDAHDALLTLRRYENMPSLSGDTDLVIEGNKQKTVAGPLFLNAYNAGNVVLALGGGCVLMGTGLDGGWHADAASEVATTTGYGLSAYHSGSSGGARLSRVDNTAVNYDIFNFNGSLGGSIAPATGGTSVAFLTTSEGDLKMGLVPLGEEDDTVLLAKMYRGRWIAAPEYEFVGGVASEMGELVPEGFFPSPTPDLAPHQDGYVPGQFDYPKWVPRLILRAQRAHAAYLAEKVRADALAETVAALSKRLDTAGIP